MSQPIRISVVFDAQGQVALRHGAESLSSVQNQLIAMSSRAGGAGRAMRYLENDINRFASIMRGRVGTALEYTNTLFERFYSFAGMLTRRALFAAVGAVGAMTAAVYGLGKAFLNVNEQFGELEVTMKSVYGSVRIARSIRDEIAKIAIRSPLSFQDIADTVRSFAAMPNLSSKIGLEAWQGQTGQGSFLNQATKLVQQMVTFRPDKTAQDATFAIREAITGELRSLIRRFEFPSALLVSSSGKSLDELKRDPDAMFKAIKAAFDRIITPQAVEEMARQPRFLFSRLVEQTIQIPLLKIGRAGEGKGSDIYKRVIAFFYNVLESSSGYVQTRFQPLADKIGVTLHKAFDRLLDGWDNMTETLLKAAGVSEHAFPGVSKFERTFILLERTLERLVEVLPGIVTKVKNFFADLIPAFQSFLKFITFVAGKLVKAFEISPYLGGAALFGMSALPTIFRGVTNIGGSILTRGAATGRASLLSGNVRNPAYAVAAPPVGGGYGMHGQAYANRLAANAAHYQGMGWTQASPFIFVGPRGVRGDIRRTIAGVRYAPGNVNAYNAPFTNNINAPIGAGPGLLGRLGSLFGYATTGTLGALGMGAARATRIGMGVAGVTAAAAGGLGAMVASVLGAVVVSAALPPLIEKVVSLFSRQKGSAFDQFKTPGSIAARAATSVREEDRTARILSFMAQLQEARANAPTDKPLNVPSVGFEKLTDMYKTEMEGLPDLLRDPSGRVYGTKKTTISRFTSTRQKVIGSFEEMADYIQQMQEDLTTLHTAQEQGKLPDTKLKTLPNLVLKGANELKDATDYLKHFFTTLVNEAGHGAAAIKQVLPDLSFEKPFDTSVQQQKFLNLQAELKKLTNDEGGFNPLGLISDRITPEFEKFQSLWKNLATGAFARTTDETQSMLQEVRSMIDPTFALRQIMEGSAETERLKKVSEARDMLKKLNTATDFNPISDYLSQQEQIGKELLALRPGMTEVQSALKKIAQMQEDLKSGKINTDLMHVFRGNLQATIVEDVRGTLEPAISEVFDMAVKSIGESKQTHSNFSKSITALNKDLASRFGLLGVDPSKVESGMNAFAAVLSSLPDVAQIRSELQPAAIEQSGRSVLDAYGNLVTSIETTINDRLLSLLKTEGDAAFDTPEYTALSDGLKEFGKVSKTLFKRMQQHVSSLTLTLEQELNMLQAGTSYLQQAMNLPSRGAGRDTIASEFIKRGNEDYKKFGVKIPKELQQLIMQGNSGLMPTTQTIKQYTAMEDFYLKTAELLRSQGRNEHALYFQSLALEAKHAREEIEGLGGAMETFSRGFVSVIDEFRATANNFTEIGSTIAKSIQTGLGDALTDVVMKTKTASEAFRDFGLSILRTAVNLMMNKLVQQLMGMALNAVGGGAGGAVGSMAGSVLSGTATGYGTATGAAFPGHARGGVIPGPPSNKDNRLAMVATGEYIIPADVVRKYGVDHFEKYRRGILPVKSSYAEGGLVGGNIASVSPMAAPGGYTQVVAPVNVQVNIDQRGVATTTTEGNPEQQSRMLAKAIQTAVQQELLRQHRQGGIYRRNQRS